MDVTFALYDRWGNFARNDTATVHLLVDSSEWGPHLYGPTAVHGAAGTAIFSGVSLDRPSVGVYLAATVRRVKSAPTSLFFDTLPGPLVSFAARGFTTCAVYGTRTYCWGYGGSAGLGTGDFVSDSVPTLVRTSQMFTSVTVAVDHTCGLTAAGEAWCWGSNTSGQVSVVPNSVQQLPVSANVGLTFTQLAAGSAFTCGRTSSQDVYCWGDNSLGQLGNGKVAGSPVLVSGGHSFQALSVGQDHACGLAAGGALYCWGRNDVAQLGVGFTSAYDSVPTLVQGGHTFTSVAAGDRHTCAIAADSTAYCWGFGGLGQLGDSTQATDSVPGPVAGAHKFVAITSGNGSCGIDVAAHLWCWGIRSEVDFFPDYAPLDLLYTGVSTVVSGSGHQCFVATSFGGRLACLGQDNAGQLGDGRHANTVFARVVAWN
jgi:hypothetical protein